MAFGAENKKIEVHDDKDRKIYSPKTGVTFLKPLNSTLGESLDLTG